MDPHAPYKPPDTWRRSFFHEGRSSVVVQLGPLAEDALEFVDLYDEEIAYMDHHVGRLLEGCAEVLELDDAMVIFTADHGETIMDHEIWFAHGYQVYEELVRVPFMLRGPGVAPGGRSGLISGIDVAKTVLSFAGAATDPNSRGLDLRSPVPIPTTRTVFAEAGGSVHWRAAIQLDRKWVLGERFGTRELLERRYYDLRADPNERNPAVEFPAGSAPVELFRLREADPDPGGRPKDLVRGLHLNAPRVHPRATKEQLEKLRGLGYVD